MARTVRPQANATLRNLIPMLMVFDETTLAENVAAPHPPNMSTPVPRNSAAKRDEIGRDISGTKLGNAELRALHGIPQGAATSPLAVKIRHAKGDTHLDSMVLPFVGSGSM
jgi:hypothetical protein